MKDRKKKIAELEEMIFKSVYRFSQRIEETGDDGSENELLSTMDKEQYARIMQINERLGLALSTIDKIVLSHVNITALAEEFVGFIADHEADLRKEFAKEQYSAHTPDEWLSMDIWSAWTSMEFLQAMNAIHGTDKPARTIIKSVESLLYPLDKINSGLWNFVDAAKDTHGQIQIQFDTAKNGRGKKSLAKTEPYLLFSINFDGLTNYQLSKRLSKYDKRVYTACDALWKAGNDVFTVSDLFRVMGNTGSPSKDQIERINSSLSKMRLIVITVNNQPELDAGYKYPPFEYDNTLLQFERIKGYFGNKTADAAVHLLRRPPLAEFAEGRGQVTKISRQLLQSPISKTETNLAIDDYLLERIGRMKGSEKTPRKILLETVYQQCEISTKKQKQRTPEKIALLLGHYQKCGWIKGFTMDEKSIQIQL